MGESPFLAFAEVHDLDYAERVASQAAGKFPLPHGEVTELVGGELPGASEGLVGRLRRSTDGDEQPSEFTLVVTRIPESLDFARFITCFEAGFRGPVSRAIGAGGLGWIREYTFESIEFNRRYRVAMLRTGKEIRLRQLFDPVFLDWMADTAPEGLYFDLVSGVLTVTLSGESVQAPADVERACELAGHIAERIRSEALEGTGLGDAVDPAGDAARAGYEAMYEEQMQRAGFQSPPTDVATALERLGPALKAKKGFLGRLFGSDKSTEATTTAMIAVLRSYGDRLGLEPRSPGGLNELLPFLDHFPLPVMRQLSLEGSLPETNAAGSLVVYFDLAQVGSHGGLNYRAALEVPTVPTDASSVRILPRGERAGPPPSLIGGFGVALGGGSLRTTEATKREREAARALSESFGGRLDVLTHRRPDPAIGEASQAWLASGAGDALILENGKLTLVGPARPAGEWSFAMLDEFRESLAPVLAETAPARRLSG